MKYYGYGTFHGISKPMIERKKKETIKIYKCVVSSSTQNVNLKIGNFFFHFLHCFQLYLSPEDLGKSNIQFFICKATLNRKANDKTAYINKNSNHPSIIKQLPKSFQEDSQKLIKQG